MSKLMNEWINEGIYEWWKKIRLQAKLQQASSCFTMHVCAEYSSYKLKVKPKKPKDKWI